MLAASLCATAASNVAYSDNNVRFTVIADGVVRMEWQPDGRFTDGPSLLAVERDYPEAHYSVTDRRGTVTVSTPRMVLTYRKGTGAFTAANTRIRSARGFFPFDWRPGDVQQGNLKGTTRTLDGLEADVQTQTWVSDMKQGERRTLDDGLLATDGWTLIDDSHGYVFDDGGDDGNPWVAERPGAEGQDWYFMAYGHDYKSALHDFTLFAGRIPLPPRYAFGYWWSRYWAYSDKELRSLVDKFDAYGIPLDVVVVDMDWHYTDPGRGGWTGWTWNRSLFPSPEDFFAAMHERGIKSTLNLHPADGVEPYEQPYAAIAARLGITDSSKVSWTGSDKRVMNAMLECMLHPMQQQGVDFWWLDWQQHLNDPVLKRLDNTWWINHLFFTDMQREGRRRPMLYHRWGGLGNHRYQVGFSGDAVISWKSLDYQPYFTSTASNVLYGYWSHDIGGHLTTHTGIDPEMYARWLQFGAYSPVMRTHSSKDARLNKEPWVFDDEWRDIIRATVRERYAMVPYIYSMARCATDTGVSLCRPLYYDWPEAPEAYTAKSQYMFGDNMLIAPVTVPADSTGYATVAVWLPEGEWYEVPTGTLLQGGRSHERRFAASEYGVYVKAGSVLPSYAPGVMRLNACDHPMVLTVYPGAADGHFTLYEDAGDSPDYARSFATTAITSHRSGTELRVDIAPRSGSYEGMPARRGFTLRVPASQVPEAVTVDGREAEWSYDGDDFAVVVPLGERDCAAPAEIVVRYAADAADTSLADGLKGNVRRVADAIAFIKLHGCDTHADELASIGTVAEAVAADPSRLHEIVDAFRASCADIHGVVARQGMDAGTAARFIARTGF